MYKVELTEEAKNDYYALTPKLQAECLRMLIKLEGNINLGRQLENKKGRDLSDCYKIFFDDAKYRIVYRKIDNTIEINGILSLASVAEVIGIGKRDLESIYKVVAYRLGRE